MKNSNKKFTRANFPMISTLKKLAKNTCIEKIKKYGVIAIIDALAILVSISIQENNLGF